ncbi:MAG: nucleotidyltransferase domain-containing protein [Pseudanabaena sp. M051S1SP1A06QC]|nr:nucleotidyltransferase domain-containing protein [Pseudanabaena sp. M051S1SP1A06QC]
MSNNQSLSELNQLVPNLTISSLRDAAVQIREQVPYLKMLVLFGSRACGDYREDSDWDFAVLYDETLQESLTKDKPYGFIEAYSVISKVLGINSDDIDIVDLGNCSEILAHRIARDGVLLYEKNKGLFTSFQKKALMSDIQVQQSRRARIDNIKLSLKRWSV